MVESQGDTPIDFVNDPRIGAALPPAGNNGRVFAILGAMCILFAAVWAYVFFGQKPRVADGSITAVTAFPLHSEIRQGGAPTEGVGGGVEKTDEMLVWVAMKERNLTNDVPLYATAQKATITMPDGQQLFANAQTPQAIAKVQAAFPELKKVQGTLLPKELTLKPGESAEGIVLFAFPMTAQQWKTRQELSVGVSYQWQRDLQLLEPASAARALMPVIESR